ncbi:hypothetical protein LV779_18030 [Streptomyces thinghirensis]|nr:hypothetical protein [Streptomyces thinghirensis]
MVLDLMLPGMDGPEVCRRMRGQGARAGHHADRPRRQDDRILGLEVGADDYVTKPFSRGSWCCGWSPCSAAPGPRRWSGPWARPA